MGWSIKKPLGSNRSVLNQGVRLTTKTAEGAVIGAVTGAITGGVPGIIYGGASGGASGAFLATKGKNKGSYAKVAKVSAITGAVVGGAAGIAAKAGEAAQVGPRLANGSFSSSGGFGTVISNTGAGFKMGAQSVLSGIGKGAGYIGTGVSKFVSGGGLAGLFFKNPGVNPETPGTRGGTFGDINLSLSPATTPSVLADKMAQPQQTTNVDGGGTPAPVAGGFGDPGAAFNGIAGAIADASGLAATTVKIVLAAALVGVFMYFFYKKHRT